MLWTDDDVQVDRSWLVEFVAAARRHPEAAAFGGPIAPWFPIAPDPLLLEVFECLRMGFCGLDLNRPEGPLPADAPVVAYGANFATRLDRLHSIRFNPALGPGPGITGGGYDEVTFLRQLQKAGETIVWCPTMRVRHYVEPNRMSLAYLEAFQEQKGYEDAILRGQPYPNMWRGAPRWLWAQYATATALRVVFDFQAVLPTRSGTDGPSGPSNSRRLRQLMHRRGQQYLRGLVRGYQHRFGAAVREQPPNPPAERSKETPRN